MSPTWHAMPIRAVAGVALIVLVILTAPGWLCFAFLSERRQASMLALLNGLIAWAQSCS